MYYHDCEYNTNTYTTDICLCISLVKATQVDLKNMLIKWIAHK